MKKKYPPGSEWLYIKVYGGPQSLEYWLATDVYRLISEWQTSGSIMRFHYVRYLDPDYHLRLRFKLADPLEVGSLLNQLNQSGQVLLDTEQFWKIEVGTYEPEYERYASADWHVLEEWFEIDSLFWLEEIRKSLEGGSYEIWEKAIQSVDAFLTDFKLTVNDKISVVKELRDSTEKFVRLDKSMKPELDQKYRKMNPRMEVLLDPLVIRQEAYLKARSSRVATIVPMLNFYDTRFVKSNEIKVLPDLIHMSLNRAFRTRHRVQELVVYDFVCRHYESMKARARMD